MDLVYECFVKLGLRYICVLKDGKYAGMVGSDFSLALSLLWATLLPMADWLRQTHKKTFVKYMRELEKEGH